MTSKAGAILMAVLLALHRAPQATGVVVGLDALLDLGLPGAS